MEEDEETMLREQEEFLAANKVRKTCLIDAHHEECNVQRSPRGIMQRLQYKHGRHKHAGCGSSGVVWETSGKIVSVLVIRAWILPRFVGTCAWHQEFSDLWYASFSFLLTPSGHFARINIMVPFFMMPCFIASCFWFSILGVPKVSEQSHRRECSVEDHCISSCNANNFDCSHTCCTHTKKHLILPSKVVQG